MVGWHHQLNGHGFGWTPGVGDGQGSLACCGSWGRKESDMTEWVNWTELNQYRRHKKRRFDPWVRKIPWRTKWQAVLDISWTEKLQLMGGYNWWVPGRLLSMGLQRVEHRWAHWIILHCVDRPHFIYLFISWWHLGCFHLLTIMNNAAE